MNKLLNCTCAETWGDIAPLVLRIATGLVFASHGYMKLQMGVPGVTGFLDSLGFPLPTFFAIILIIVELVGGVLMILGLFTHWIAKLFIIVAAVAYLVVMAPKGLGAAGGYEFLLFAASVSLMITGAGKYSLDHKFMKHSHGPDHAQDPMNMM